MDTKKTKKKIQLFVIIRFLIQLVFFLCLPALFSAAFNGIKYVANQIHNQALITWNPFLTTLVVLLGFTVIFGRFFCGFACAFGSLGDWLFACSSALQKMIRKKVWKLPQKAISILSYGKYLVLAVIIALCLTGNYERISAADPWELFASFIAGNFAIATRYYALAVLLFIIIGMLLVERFFCQFLCPMGAVFALMPMFPFFTFNRQKDDCIPGCSLCTRTCPAAITFDEENSRYHDCFQCGKCSEKCPKQNLRLGIRKLRGTEIWLMIAKAAILFAICYPLMNG